MNWQKASGYNRRPTKEQRNDRALASCGTAQDAIARYLRISTHTLRLHFRDELDTAAIPLRATSSANALVKPCIPQSSNQD
jgi:hypothetical protein